MTCEISSMSFYLTSLYSRCGKLWDNFASNQYTISNLQRNAIGVAEFQVSSSVRFYLTELFGFVSGNLSLELPFGSHLQIQLLQQTHDGSMVRFSSDMDPINLSHSCIGKYTMDHMDPSWGMKYVYKCMEFASQ